MAITPPSSAAHDLAVPPSLSKPDSPALPSLQAPGGRRGLVEAVLGPALAAQRAGTLDELLRRRPRLTRWFARRLLPPVRAIAGDAVPDDPLQPAAWQLLLRALLARLRPDGASRLAAIDPDDWTERTSWRPLLALACQHGLLAPPQFPDLYRARSGESAAEQLCGLWAVGPSTFYRYVDKGRRMLADALVDTAASGERRAALDALLQEEVYALLQLEEPPARAAWHARQAAAALAARDGCAALWHLMRAGDVAGFIHCLQRFRVELASDPATEPRVQQLAAQDIDWRLRFWLCQARAGLWRVRGVEQAERDALDEALRIASTANDRLMLGIVYGALGKIDESRDPDRAFSCYQESAEFLRQAGLPDDPAAADADVLEAYVHTLVHLGWLYVLRNDPRSKAVLDRAEALREHCPQATGLLGMLEQAWGEYWRRSGELRRAIEHKHRALHTYERLGDRQAILKTYGNLALIYGDAKDFPRAIEYSQRVLDMAAKFSVEPETVASTHLNVGAAYFWQGKYDAAIDHYERALQISQRAALRVLVGRAHYNLAEAFYKRFQVHDRADDERQGDAHAAAALLCWPEIGGNPEAMEATRNLKREILGPRDNEFYDRLLPAELAAHFDEMSQVQRQRAALALPLAAEDRIVAHLAIARAYLEIAVKEREAAVALIDRQGLGPRFADDLQGLREVFDRGLSREQQLSAKWREATGDLFDWSGGALLLQHLLRAGSVNKSGYALQCRVAPATASKHLAKLAERGLLVQTGKGPSTRYLLPP
jgi:tetratricopeptide (TPR) repeat protein